MQEIHELQLAFMAIGDRYPHCVTERRIDHIGERKFGVEIGIDSVEDKAVESYTFYIASIVFEFYADYRHLVRHGIYTVGIVVKINAVFCLEVGSVVYLEILYGHAVPWIGKAAAVLVLAKLNELVKTVLFPGVLRVHFPKMLIERVVSYAPQGA